MDIGRVTMMVEVDGQACVVALSQEKMLMLVSLAGSLSESGKLPIKKLGKEYRFETIENPEKYDKPEVCGTCGGIGWSAGCGDCIPY